MSRTALIIDNDENTVSQVNASLSALGYTVSSASDASTGLGMANSIIPSILLVNLATPGSNGLELCKSIHNSDSLKDVPIILLTLREGKFDPVYVKLYGIVAFLKKPFDDRSITALVTEHSLASGEAYIEPEAEVYAEPEAEAYAEPVDELDAFDMSDTYDDQDATVAMTVDDMGEDAISLEAEDAGNEFGETVTLSDVESDLGDLQASFSQPDYTEDDTVSVSMDEVSSADDSFDFSSSGLEGEDTEEPEYSGSGWGDMTASMAMDETDSDNDEDETWGMGGEMAMTDAFGQDSDTDQGLDTVSSFDAPADTGFESEGTMAFDSTGETGFSAGGDLDSEGTVTFDSTPGPGPGSEETGDIDIGGFNASRDSAPSEGGFDAGSFDDSVAWSEGTVETMPDTGDDKAVALDDTDDAFSSGFEEDEEEETVDFTEAGGFDEEEGTVDFTEAGGFDEEEGTVDFTEAGGFDEEEGTVDFTEAGMSDMEEVSFDGEDAGFDDDFLESADDTTADFAGDDQDYTGLFDPISEEGPVEEKKSKKKRKKGFKKGSSSRLTRLMALLLVLALILGGAYYYRDMLPFEIPDDISFKLPDLPDMPDWPFNIPFFGNDSEEKAKAPPEPMPKPPAEKPEPAPEVAKQEPKPAVQPIPKPDRPRKAHKKEPVAPKQKVVKAPVKKPRPKVVAKAPVKQPEREVSRPAGKFMKGNFYVQFGVFANQKNADTLSGQLKRKGFPTIQIPLIASKGKKFTVVLLDEPYKSRDDADSRGKGITRTTGFDTAVYR